MLDDVALAPRRIQKILEEKQGHVAEIYHSLFGPDCPVEGIVFGDDGLRQRACWGPYVLEQDKPWLKAAHGSIFFVLAFLPSVTTARITGRANHTSAVRKYRASTILRDLVDYVVTDDAGISISAIPLDMCCLSLQPDTRMVLGAKDALDGHLGSLGGRELIEWWNAVLAQDIDIPVRLFSHPVPRALGLFV